MAASQELQPRSSEYVLWTMVVAAVLSLVPGLVVPVNQVAAGGYLDTRKGFPCNAKEHWQKGALFPCGTKEQRNWLTGAFFVAASKDGRKVEIRTSHPDRIVLGCAGTSCDLKVTLKKEERSILGAVRPVWVVKKSMMNHADTCKPVSYYLQRGTLSHLLLLRRGAVQPLAPGVDIRNKPLHDLRTYTFAEVHHGTKVDPTSKKATNRLSAARATAQKVLEESWAPLSDNVNEGLRDELATSDFKKHGIIGSEPYITNIVRYHNAKKLRDYIEEHPWAVHFTKQNHSTPLHKAVYDGLVEHVKVLVAAGARPWVCTGGGFSAVDHARYGARKAAGMSGEGLPNAYKEIETILKEHCETFCCRRCCPSFDGDTKWDALETSGDTEKSERHRSMVGTFDRRIRKRVHNVGRGSLAL